MDILQDFIKSLAKEELKSYKLFAKRTHNFEDRKDIVLFDSIKNNPDNPDKFHFESVYGKTNPDPKYYRLKNKITDDLGVVLVNLNHRKPETDTLHLLSLARIFNSKKQKDLSWHYLKLAERKAMDQEDFSMLEAVYEQMIRLSIQHNEASPDEIIKKRTENNKRLALLQELENNLAILSHQVKTTQNLTSKKEIAQWLNHTLKTTLKLAYVKNSSQLRIKIFQNISRLLLLLKDYQSLEQYLKSCLEEFEADRLFTRQTHEVKLQLLVYLCNASYLLNKHTQSVQYAGILHKALYEHGKELYNQYIFYYYNILVNNYSKTNLNKAIETLEEAQKERQIRENPEQYFYVLSNLAISLFDLKKYRQAGKLFSQIYVLPNYKNFDPTFVLKLEIFELITRIELEDFDLCEKQIHHLNKLVKEIRDKDSVRIDVSVLRLLGQYLSQEDKRWRPVKREVQEFIKKYDQDKTQAGVINYCQWLSSKV